MATVSPTSPKPVAQPRPVAQPKPAASTALPLSGMVSPYDGTSSMLGTPTMAGLAGTPIPGAAGMPGIGGAAPQTNATNQSAYAPNGDVNQHVLNENQYVNKYYNIIVPNGGLFGGLGAGLGGMFGSWASPQGNAFMDPQTGVLYVQQEQGFMGWVKRLFRGY